MVFVLGSVLIFAALFLVFSAVGGLAPERRGVSRSLEVLEAMTNAPTELTAELDSSFSERVLEPVRERAAAIGRRVTGADQMERIRHRLDRAGNPAGWTVDKVAAYKVIGAVCGLVGGILFSSIMGWAISVAILAVVVAIALGFQFPNIYLYNIASKRDQTMQRELADAIDLLTISVEAGLGFDAALQQVAHNTEGPLALEFNRLLQEVQIGRGRMEALRALGDRATLPDVRSFVSAMVQADSFGIPIAQVLRVQSQEVRVKRRQRAEEMAAKVPVKIMVPVVLFILPCLFVVVIGPAVISITKAL